MPWSLKSSRRSLRLSLVCASDVKPSIRACGWRGHRNERLWAYRRLSVDDKIRRRSLHVALQSRQMSLIVCRSIVDRQSSCPRGHPKPPCQEPAPPPAGKRLVAGGARLRGGDPPHLHQRPRARHPQPDDHRRGKAREDIEGKAWRSAGLAASWAISGCNKAVQTADTAPDASKATLDAVKGAFGFVPNLQTNMATSPELLAD